MPKAGEAYGKTIFGDQLCLACNKKIDDAHSTFIDHWLSHYCIADSISLKYIALWDQRKFLKALYNTWSMLSSNSTYWLLKALLGF